MSRYLRTPRTALLDGGIALCLLAPLMLLGGPALVSGCSDGTRTRDVVQECPTTPTAAPGDQAPRHQITTPEGVTLHYPIWLDQHPTSLDLMLEQIRTADTPPGTTLFVLDPGAYYAPYSPTGLAHGEWRAPSTIYVAWRGLSTGPVLPALDHELNHLRTQDPNAGHK